MEGTAYCTGYDHARNGHYFDPLHRYDQRQRDDYRRGYTVGHDLRVKERSQPVRRAFKG